MTPDLLKAVEDLRGRALMASLRHKEAEERASSLFKQAAGLKQQIRIHEDASILARKCLERTIALKSHIEDIVSRGLQAVLELDYTYSLEPVLDEEGGIKGIKRVLKSPTGKYTDLEDFGDCANQVVEICERLAVLGVTPDTAPVLIMDEPGAGVAESLQPKLQNYLMEACGELDVQLVVVSHHSHPFGRVYGVYMDENGVSKVELIKDE